MIPSQPLEHVCIFECMHMMCAATIIYNDMRLYSVCVHTCLCACMFVSVFGGLWLCLRFRVYVLTPDRDVTY